MENKKTTGMYRRAIKVDKPIKVYWPQHEKKGIFDPSYAKKLSLQHCYATNNGVIAYIDEGAVYVLPYSRIAMRELQENGFSEKGFYVPFSNWDYPVEKKNEWEKLKEEAKVLAKQDFKKDCITLAESKGVQELNSEFWEKCMKIPYSGLEVKHPYYENVIYPAIQGYVLDCVSSQKIGTYCINNGTCVFVNTQGDTYVTRDLQVIDKLIESGYKRNDLYVPLSNGETIVNRHFAEKWRRISA